MSNSRYPLLAIAASLALGICTAASATTTEPVNPALLYHNYCSVCHGDRGDGNSRASNSLTPPPRNFTTELSRNELTRDRIVRALHEGRPGTAMVSWSKQLSDTEISAVANYLLATFIHPQQDAGSHPGKALYEQNCAVCHGDKGDGGRWTSGMKLRPRDFTSERGRALSREQMLDAVHNGRPGTPMASFAGQLSEEQMAQTVDYIRLAFMQARPEISGLSGTYAHGTPTAATAASTQQVVAMDEPLPEHLSGDLARGRDFYMGNCFTCHGVNGDGQGPRAYFINPKPANFLSDKYRSFNRPAIFKAVRDGKLGTEMPAWGKVLTAQQLADVSEFVFRAFIQGDESALRGGEIAKKKP